MEATEEQALLTDDGGAAARTRTTTESSEATSLQLSSPELLNPERPVMAKMSLYSSHLMSTWGQRMWEFAIGLIMLEMYPSSLALVSAFGLVDGLAKVFSGSLVGSYIDRTGRLRAACSIGISLVLGRRNLYNRHWQHQQCGRTRLIPVGGEGMDSCFMQRRLSGACKAKLRHESH
ncbi:hypothetical protein WJX82_001237 [Trebouxia sp. C0006]